MLLKGLKLRSSLDSQLGRLVYGNLTSFTCNFEGRKNLSRLRRHLPRATKRSDFIYQMDRYGCYFLPFTIPATTMEPVIASFQVHCRILCDPMG